MDTFQRRKPSLQPHRIPSLCFCFTPTMPDSPLQLLGQQYRVTYIRLPDHVPMFRQHPVLHLKGCHKTTRNHIIDIRLFDILRQPQYRAEPTHLNQRYTYYGSLILILSHFHYLKDI